MEEYKGAVIALGMKVYTAIVTLCAICLPLIIYPNDAYVGVTGTTWLVHGAAYGAIGFVFCSVFCFFFTSSLLKRGVYTLSEKQTTVYQHNFKLKRGCALALLAVLLGTLVAHAALTGGWDALSVMEGISFDDWDSFKAYMEQDVPATYSFGSGMAEEIASHDGIYWDADGNQITGEEALRRTMEDADGNVLCEYIERNRSVSSIRYGNANGNWLPVTVYTIQDRYDGSQRIHIINSIFAAVYLVEAAAAMLVYMKKRTK